jgi:GntR family transcriptional repressor for pyruvate dehydrogenase complex
VQARHFQTIVARIETMIRDGKVSVGDYLPFERELMARFGLGRPMVREALVTLQQSGRIQVINGSAPALSSQQRCS